MRKLALAAGTLLAGLAMAGVAQAKGLAVTVAPVVTLAPTLTVTSPDLNHGKRFPTQFVGAHNGCPGKEISPAISWSGAPAGTKSFAVSIYDPDAPTGSGFWHWSVFNIPPTVTSLPQNAGDPKAGLLPAGATEVHNDGGGLGYTGPCPPKGDKPHHYHIRVFAVDADKLDVSENNAPAVVGFNLHFHTLAWGEMVRVWSR